MVVFSTKQTASLVYAEAFPFALVMWKVAGKKEWGTDFAPDFEFEIGSGRRGHKRSRGDAFRRGFFVLLFVGLFFCVCLHVEQGVFSDLFLL